MTYLNMTYPQNQDMTCLKNDMSLGFPTFFPKISPSSHLFGVINASTPFFSINHQE